MATAGTVEGAKKTTVYLQEALHRELRFAAFDAGTSMNKMVEQALRNHLAKIKNGKRGG